MLKDFKSFNKPLTLSRISQRVEVMVSVSIVLALATRAYSWIWSNCFINNTIFTLFDLILQMYYMNITCNSSMIMKIIRNENRNVYCMTGVLVV